MQKRTEPESGKNTFGCFSMSALLEVHGFELLWFLPTLSNFHGKWISKNLLPQTPYTRMTKHFQQIFFLIYHEKQLMLVSNNWEKKFSQRSFLREVHIWFVSSSSETLAHMSHPRPSTAPMGPYFLFVHGLPYLSLPMLTLKPHRAHSCRLTLHPLPPWNHLLL